MLKTAFEQFYHANEIGSWNSSIMLMKLVIKPLRSLTVSTCA